MVMPELPLELTACALLHRSDKRTLDIAAGWSTPISTKIIASNTSRFIQKIPWRDLTEVRQQLQGCLSKWNISPRNLSCERH